MILSLQIHWFLLPLLPLPLLSKSWCICDPSTSGGMFSLLLVPFILYNPHFWPLLLHPFHLQTCPFSFLAASISECWTVSSGVWCHHTHSFCANLLRTNSRSVKATPLTSKTARGQFAKITLYSCTISSLHHFHCIIMSLTLVMSPATCNLTYQCTNLFSGLLTETTSYGLVSCSPCKICLFFCIFSKTSYAKYAICFIFYEYFIDCEIQKYLKNSFHLSSVAYCGMMQCVLSVWTIKVAYATLHW